MSNNRGMKRWLPFSNLVEQQTFIDKMLYEKYKIDRPRVSIEQARKIDRLLKEYSSTSLTFKLYMDGYLYTYKGKIVKLDKNKKIVYFDDFFIPLINIIDIEDPDPFSDIC